MTNLSAGGFQIRTDQGGLAFFQQGDFVGARIAFGQDAKPILADCQLVAYRSAGFNPVAIASRRYDRARNVARRHGLPKVYRHYRQLLADPEIEVLDIAVPPDVQYQVVRDAVQQKESGRNRLRGILAQKPLGIDYRQAVRIERMCRRAGITLAVNQNMRWDQSVRAGK